MRLGWPETRAYLRHKVDRTGAAGPRVLIVGDSFFYRHPGTVDIHDRLRDAFGSGALLNPSEPGTGPLQYLGHIARHGADFQPDVVLVSHFVGNDLGDVGAIPDVDAAIRSAVAAPATKPVHQRPFVWQFVDAALTDHLTPGLSRGAYEAAGLPPEEIDAALEVRVNPWVVQFGVVHRHYFRDALLLTSVEARQAWSNTERVLDAIVKRSRALGARVVPVIFPHTLQVDTRHHALFRRWRIQVDPAMLTTDRPQALLREYYRRQGIEVLDLLPDFRAAKEPLFLDRDDHLRPQGDAFAAERIAAFLRAGEPGKERR